MRGMEEKSADTQKIEQALVSYIQAQYPDDWQRLQTLTIEYARLCRDHSKAAPLIRDEIQRALDDYDPADPAKKEALRRLFDKDSRIDEQGSQIITLGGQQFAQGIALIKKVVGDSESLSDFIAGFCKKNPHITYEQVIQSVPSAVVGTMGDMSLAIHDPRQSATDKNRLWVESIMSGSATRAVRSPGN